MKMKFMRALTQNLAVENYMTTNSHLIRYQAGISLKYALNEHFKLQTDMSFNQMGGTFTSLVTDINGVREEADLTTKVTYITLPINAQYHMVTKWSIIHSSSIIYRF